MDTLNIPLYRQTCGFSCGAASLVMALNALRNNPVNRSEEFELWRMATMIGMPGIDQWGLATAALQRGVQAQVLARSDITFRKEDHELQRWFTPEQLELSDFVQQENRIRALRAGVIWHQRDPTWEDITTCLSRRQIPVLLVDKHTLCAQVDVIPHWVVATGCDGEIMTVHDPAPDSPPVRHLPVEEAWRCLDISRYAATRTVVILGP